MFAPYFIVVSAKKGMVQTIQLFQEEDRAVGYAQTMYGNGCSGIDDAVVFVVDPETGQGDEIFTVSMEEGREKEDLDDDYLEDEEEPEAILLLATEFTLVDVEKLYGEASLPSKTIRKSLKIGKQVMIECSTMDTHEKCVVEITKIVKNKPYRYEGILVNLPEYFEVPPRSKIRFSEANILNIL